MIANRLSGAINVWARKFNRTRGSTRCAAEGGKPSRGDGDGPWPRTGGAYGSNAQAPAWTVAPVRPPASGAGAQ